MICPSCGQVNVPGADACLKCLFALSSIDSNPSGQDIIEESVLRGLVKQLKPKQPVTIPLHETLGLALHRMIEHAVGALLVVDQHDCLVGILTERDYLQKVVGLVDDYPRQPLQAYMTSAPETVTPDDPIGLALQKMDVGGYRHLPVVSDGKPVGIISVRDVIRHITKLCSLMH